MFRTIINKFKTKTQPDVPNETPAPDTTSSANVNGTCKSEEGKKHLLLSEVSALGIFKSKANAKATPSKLPGATNWILTGGKVDHTVTEIITDSHWETLPPPETTDKGVLSNKPKHEHFLRRVSSDIQTTKINTTQHLGTPCSNKSTYLTDCVVKKVATCPNFQSLTRLQPAKLSQTLPYTCNAPVDGEKIKQKAARSVSLDVKNKTRCKVFVKFKEETQVLSMTSFIDKFYVKPPRNENEEPKLRKECGRSEALERKLTVQNTVLIKDSGGKRTKVGRHSSQNRNKTQKNKEVKTKRRRNESKKANKSIFYNVDLCFGEKTFNLLPGSNLESDILPPEMLSSTSSRHRFLRVTDRTTGEQFQLRVPDEPPGKEQHSLRTKSSLLYFLTEALDQTDCVSKMSVKIPGIKASKVIDFLSPITEINNDTKLNAKEEIKDRTDFNYDYFNYLEATETRTSLNDTQLQQDPLFEIISGTEYSSTSFEKHIIIERKNKIHSNDKKCTLSSKDRTEESNTFVVLESRLIDLHCNSDWSIVEVDPKTCINNFQRKSEEVPKANKDDRQAKKDIRQSQAIHVDDVIERATLNNRCHLKSGRNQAVLVDDIIERDTSKNMKKLVDEIIERPIFNSEYKLKSGINQFALAEEVTEGPILNNGCRRKSRKHTSTGLHTPKMATPHSVVKRFNQTSVETIGRSVSSIQNYKRDEDLDLEEVHPSFLAQLITNLSDIEEVLETSTTDASKTSIYKSSSNDDENKSGIVNFYDITLLNQNDVSTGKIENLSSQCTNDKQNNEELVSSLCPPIIVETSGSYPTVNVDNGTEDSKNIEEHESEILAPDSRADIEVPVECEGGTVQGKILKYYKQRNKSPAVKRYRPFGMPDDGHEGLLGKDVCSQNQGIAILPTNCGIGFENINHNRHNAHGNKNINFYNKCNEILDVPETNTYQDIREKHSITEFRNTRTVKSFRHSQTRTTVCEYTEWDQSRHLHERNYSEESVEFLNEDDTFVASDVLEHSRMSKEQCALESKCYTHHNDEIINKRFSAVSNTSITKRDLQDDSKTSILKKSVYSCNISRYNEADAPFVRLKFKVLGQENSLVSMNIACMPSSKKKIGKTLKYYKNNPFALRKSKSSENTGTMASQYNMCINNGSWDMKNNANVFNKANAYTKSRKRRYILKIAKKKNSSVKKRRYIKEKVVAVKSIPLRSCTKNVEWSVVSAISQTSSEESWVSFGDSQTSLDHSSEEIFQSCLGTLSCPNLSVSSQIIYLKKNTDTIGYLADCCKSTSDFGSSFSSPQIEYSISSVNCKDTVSLLKINISKDEDYLSTAESFIHSDNSRDSILLLDNVAKTTPKNENCLTQDENSMPSDNSRKKLTLLKRDNSNNIPSYKKVKILNPSVVESSNALCTTRTRLPTVNDCPASTERSHSKLTSQRLKFATDQHSKKLSSSQGSNLQSSPNNNCRTVDKVKSQPAPTSNSIRAKNFDNPSTRRKKTRFPASKLIKKGIVKSDDNSSQDDKLEKLLKDEKRSTFVEVYPQIKRNSSETVSMPVEKASSEIKKSFHVAKFLKPDNGFQTMFDLAKSRKYQNSPIRVEDLQPVIRKYGKTKARFVIKCNQMQHERKDLDTEKRFLNLSLDKCDSSAVHFTKQQCVNNRPNVKNADLNDVEYETSLHQKENKRLIQLLEKLFGILDNQADKKIGDQPSSERGEESQEKLHTRYASKKRKKRRKKNRKKYSKSSTMNEDATTASKEKETRYFLEDMETDNNSEQKQTPLSSSDELHEAFPTRTYRNNLQIEHAIDYETVSCPTSKKHDTKTSALHSSFNYSQHSSHLAKLTETEKRLDPRKVGKDSRESEDEEVKNLADKFGMNIPKYKMVKMHKDMDTNALADKSDKIIPNIADECEYTPSSSSKNTYTHNVAGVQNHFMMSSPKIQRHKIGEIFVKLPKILTCAVTAINSTEDTLQITKTNKYQNPINNSTLNNYLMNVQEEVKRSQEMPCHYMQSDQQHNLNRPLDSRIPQIVHVETVKAKPVKKEVENSHSIKETYPTVDESNTRYCSQETWNSSYTTYNENDLDGLEDTDQVFERYHYEKPGLQVNYVRIGDRMNIPKERNNDHGCKIQDIDGDGEATQTVRVEEVKARKKHRREVIAVKDDGEKLKKKDKKTLLLNEQEEEPEEYDDVTKNGVDVKLSDAPKEEGGFRGFMKNKVMPVLRAVTVGPTLDEHVVKTYRLLRGDPHCDNNSSSDADE